MNKAELIQEVEKLIREGKTKEAFQLLSKAQLSKNDRRLILLMGQYSQLEEETLTNQLSHEEEHRLRTRLHNSMLKFLEKIDHKEIGKNKTSHAISPVVKKEDRQGFIKKYKYYLLPVLLIPLIIAVLLSRISEPVNKPVKHGLIGQTGADYSTTFKNVSDDFLKKSANVWRGRPEVFFEDFSDRQSESFRKDIWKLENTSRDHWMGVFQNRFYKIKINNGKANNAYTRHKYIGGIDYDAGRDIIPFYAKVVLSKQRSCKDKNFCMGRGPTIRYHKSKRSAYAYTLNDEGLLQFRRLKNFNKPMDGKLLFKRSINIKPNEIYELGLVAKENKFFLYLDQKIIKIVKDDNPLTGTYNGIIASGEGEHLFDEIGLFAPLNK